MKYLYLLLFTLIPALLFAQSGTKDGSFEAKNMDQLRIRVDAGMTIKINGSQTDQISYSYDFDGNDQAYDHLFKNFKPEFSTRGGEAFINIEFPEHRKKNVNFRIKKNILVLNVPKAIELELTTRYSKIEVTNIDRTTRIDNRGGSVKLRDIGQNATISNEYGNIDVQNNNGDVDISSRSSTIDVSNVKGNLLVNSNYSKLNLTKITGQLNLENKSGTVNAYDLDSDLMGNGDYTEYELTDVRGTIQIYNKSGTVHIDKAENVLIHGDYTNITASNLKGDEVQIESKSSNVELKNVLGRVIINGSYLEIELDNISKQVSVKNRSGKVTAQSLKNSILIDGDYNKIKLESFEGSEITIENRSGDIEIDALKTLSSVYIKASYTNIELNLRSSFQGDVNFDVTYGKLKQPFKLNQVIISDEKNSLNIQGSVASGNGKMIIESRSGDVTIKQ